jgi:hypothetical protein
MMFCKKFSSYIFPSFVDDIHIIGLVFIVHLVFDHCVSQLAFMGFMIQPHKVFGLVAFPIYLLVFFLLFIFVAR